MTSRGAPRFHGIRIIDPVAGVLALWLFFALALRKQQSSHAVAKSLALALVCVIPLGIFAHVLFRVPTTLNCRLGLSKCPLK